MFTTETLNKLFSLQGKVAIVTGGAGVLGGAMAHGLAAAGAKIGILDRRAEKAAQTVAALCAAGGMAMALPADVLDRDQLNVARDQILAQWGRIDILINAAGGNTAEASIVGERTFFNQPREAIDHMLNLNFMGSLIPAQVFGEVMTKTGSGAILNISSMAAVRTLTRALGYGAAKTAIDNFTRWLAVEMCLRYSPQIRINAIAPGFFIGEQNRDILLTPDKNLTQRGQQIISHTPMGRFGEPEELIGAAVWLCSDAAHFVTGIVVPIDGGFSTYSGV